ncbi:MAG: hypothetical protein KC933_20155 [Myxococcales bacterium]|nr:hypothetical protein [Myxococcales bacterium]MCB9646000.1 hypothetical protein [Deltaproteobacteria bacterium]
MVGAIQSGVGPQLRGVDPQHTLHQPGADVGVEQAGRATLDRDLQDDFRLTDPSDAPPGVNEGYAARYGDPAAGDPTSAWLSKEEIAMTDEQWEHKKEMDKIREEAKARQSAILQAALMRS